MISGAFYDIYGRYYTASKFKESEQKNWQILQQVEKEW